MVKEDNRQVEGEGQGSGPLNANQDNPEQANPESRNPTTDVHAYIGRQLRAVYDDVAKQPVPDRFLELMKQLDAVSARD